MSDQWSCTSADPGVARREHVVHGRQLFEVERDGAGDILGLRTRRRDAHRDDLADEAHLVGCERGLLGDLEAAQARNGADRLDAYEIGSGENRVT